MSRWTFPDTPCSEGLPAGVRQVTEVSAGDFPAVVHPEWTETFPWLVHGTTTRGPALGPTLFDLRVFPRSAESLSRWDRLLLWSGLNAAVHSRQVHEAEIRRHAAATHDGLTLCTPCDGHLASEPDLLVAVSVADCVPVFFVHPALRMVAMVHAGWRGSALGILEEALAALAEEGAAPAELYLHFGPSICGSCYEVGGEVFESLGLPRPSAPTPIDLRAVLARRAIDAGLNAEHVTVSAHCTLCDPQRRFFSHRAGDEGRQVGFLGTRP